jgi:hypothetical protein
MRPSLAQGQGRQCRTFDIQPIAEQVRHQIGDGAEGTAAKHQKTPSPVENLRHLTGKGHHFVGLHKKGFFEHCGVLAQGFADFIL